MRFLVFFLAVVVAAGSRAEDSDKAVTPAEAAKKVNEKVTVEMEVKSTGGREACFLNSEADYKDAKNFAVFISEAALVKFKEAKIENPKEFYKGKLVRVTGMVVLYRDKPEIKVDSPDQIALVEKK